MKVPPVQEVHYGTRVWVNPTLEVLRRAECLCWNCSKLHPGAADNCTIAQALYDLCVQTNIAAPVVRCPDWGPK